MLFISFCCPNSNQCNDLDLSFSFSLVLNWVQNNLFFFFLFLLLYFTSFNAQCHRCVWCYSEFVSVLIRFLDFDATKINGYRQMLLMNRMIVQLDFFLLLQVFISSSSLVLLFLLLERSIDMKIRRNQKTKRRKSNEWEFIYFFSCFSSLSKKIIYFIFFFLVHSLLRSSSLCKTKHIWLFHFNPIKCSQHFQLGHQNDYSLV